MTNAATASVALSYADALNALLRDVAPLPSEQIALEDALGRALATDVQSPIALPPWDNAGMDGYAVRRADVHGASDTHPVSLTVVGSIAAGADPATLPVIEPRTAARIMTGAPVPRGADAVVRIEDTDRGTTRVTIVSDRDLAGRGNVRPRGEDVESGAVVFARGTTIGASHLGALASVGCAMPTVHRQPRVTILASGDELVLLDRFDEVQAGRRIVSSTSYALPALLRQAGANVRVLPLLADNLDAVTDALRSAVLDGCDLLVTTGGVSVGAHDYTRDALAALGGTLGFWRARIRPGGPIGTGQVLGVPWLGLPGNPVSTMVTGALFALPLIRTLGGHAAVHHAPLRVRVCETVDTPAALTYFVRVRLTVAVDGVLEARLAGPQGSNLLRTMALADALLVVPETVVRAEAGMILSALLLPGAELLSAIPATLLDFPDVHEGDHA
jgi:molybdopterin molybdotransferase